MRSTKYKNTKILIGGKVFDSKAEYLYYTYLLLLEEAGDITDLKLQVAYPMIVIGFDNKKHTICKYIADFTYLDKDGKLCVDDVKNPVLAKGATFRIKAKLFKALYGVEINIISPKSVRR